MKKIIPILNVFKKMSRRKKLLLLVIFGVLFFLITRKPAVKVETFTVTRGDIIETISSSGNIDADEKADLTFQGNGRLAWVGVKVGDRVKKYQAIASLDKLLLNSSYQQAINTYKALEAAAQKAEDDVKGHSADETYTQKSTRMAAQVARDNAYDAMRSAEQTLKYATIIAPFDGIMTQVNPSFTGSNVTYVSAVYSIVNPETFYFSTEVNEIDVAKIKVGQKIVLSLDAFPEKQIESTIADIGFSSVVTSTGGTAYKVKIALPKIEGVEYRLGMNGDVEILINTFSDVLYVPVEAVIEGDEGSFVWVVNGNKKVRKVKIELGASGVENSEIKSGLSEGEIVVVRPPVMIKAGSKVKI